MIPPSRPPATRTSARNAHARKHARRRARKHARRRARTQASTPSPGQTLSMEWGVCAGAVCTQYDFACLHGLDVALDGDGGEGCLHGLDVALGALYVDVDAAPRRRRLEPPLQVVADTRTARHGTAQPRPAQPRPARPSPSQITTPSLVEQLASTSRARVPKLPGCGTQGAGYERDWSTNRTSQLARHLPARRACRCLGGGRGAAERGAHLKSGLWP
jgi:hypothetical protein